MDRGGRQAMGPQRVRQDWLTCTCFYFNFCSSRVFSSCYYPLIFKSFFFSLTAPNFFLLFVLVSCIKKVFLINLVILDLFIFKSWALKTVYNLKSFSSWFYQESSSKSAVPNLFSTRDWLHGRLFFHGSGRVSGLFKCITFIVHFIPIIISASPQIIKH